MVIYKLKDKWSVKQKDNDDHYRMGSVRRRRLEDCVKLEETSKRIRWKPFKNFWELLRTLRTYHWCVWISKIELFLIFWVPIKEGTNASCFQFSQLTVDFHLLLHPCRLKERSFSAHFTSIDSWLARKEHSIRPKFACACWNASCH